MKHGGWQFRAALVATLTMVPLGMVALTDTSAAATSSCVLVENPTLSHHTMCPGQDLIKVPWAHENLRYADLAGSNLTGAHFRLAHLDWANLSGATLTDALMQESTATHANFTRANLTNVNMQDSTLDHADMTDAQFLSRPDSLQGPNVDMTGASMPFSILNGARVEGVWTDVDLQDGKLRGVIATPYFSHTILVHADLTNATIFTNWQNADLRLAIFCNTYLQGKGIDNSGCPKK